MASTCKARRRWLVGDSARGWLLLPMELCSTHVSAQPWGAGGSWAQPLTQALSFQGHPAKRGRGEQEVKGFLFSRCFIMGLLVPKKCFKLIW